MDKQNKVDYVELASKDMDSTRSFFAKVFGWEFKMWGEGYMDTPSGGVTLGFYQADLSSLSEAGGALVTIYRDNLESALDDVTKNGGRITKEIFSFPGGRRFQFLEPGGNEFCVWSAE